MRHRNKVRFILFFLVLFPLSCEKSEKVEYALGTEYRLPTDNECVGFQDILRGFLIANVAMPLIQQDAFAGFLPGLAKSWKLESRNNLCFTIDTGRTFSNATPITAKTVKSGLETAFKTYPDYLWKLKTVKMSLVNEDEICLRFENGLHELLLQLSLPLAAPFIKSENECFFAGDFVLEKKALKHRKTGEKIHIVPVETSRDKFDFLRNKRRVNIFFEPQMNTAEMSAAKNMMTEKVIPDRGTNRVGFLYAKKKLPSSLTQCLRQKIHEVHWPFSTANPAKTFLPAAFWGESTPLHSDLVSEKILSSDPAKQHFIKIVTSTMYDNESTKQFFKDWFQSCQSRIDLVFLPKNQFEEFYRSNTLSFDLIFNTVGITYPDPRPSLQEYFVAFESPLAWRGGLFPLIHFQAPIHVHANGTKEELIAWEKSIMESYQILPVSHFTPYTLLTSPSDHLTDCLPQFASPIGLSLACLFED